MLNQAPIGVFDSGVGGISVLRDIRRLLPAEDVLYVADSGYCPYGGRLASDIIARAHAITRFLLDQGAKLIVVACNTATIAAVHVLREAYAVPFVGMEPAVKPAVLHTLSGVVGVLATGAALGGEKFQRLVANHAGHVQVINQPCPGLVDRIEVGDLDGPQTRQLLERYIAPLLDVGADMLVLGCTHYPFLRPLIADIAGPQVQIIDSGAAVARQTQRLLAAHDLLNPQPQAGWLRWYTSGDRIQVERVIRQLWDAPVQVQPLPPESTEL